MDCVIKNALCIAGEKLSKQQLQSNNIIKKLRTKEKENDAFTKTQKQVLYIKWYNISFCLYF